MSSQSGGTSQWGAHKNFELLLHRYHQETAKTLAIVFATKREKTGLNKFALIFGQEFVGRIRSRFSWGFPFPEIDARGMEGVIGEMILR